MELKFVIPNMEKTFGNLEFAGEDKTEQRRINGRMAVLSRSFIFIQTYRGRMILWLSSLPKPERNILTLGTCEARQSSYHRRGL